MTVAEMACRKVLDDKEKKRKKAEEKAAANPLVGDILGEKVNAGKDVGKDGSRKKRKVKSRPQMPPVSEHVSSPTPLNHAKPLEALANEEHASPHVSAGRMDLLRTQPDEHVASPPAHINENTREIYEDADATPADEGHVDNEGGLFDLKTQPTPIRRTGRHLEAAEKLVCDKIIPDEEASKCLFAHSCIGLTDSSRMDNSYECRDMMANLFTPADDEFFNEGVRNESAIRLSWKMLCQSAQQQANTLLRFEALTEEHDDLVYAHESCKDVKAHYKDFQKELAKVQVAYDRKVSDYDQLSKNYEDRIQQLEEALKQSEADADQLRREKEHYDVEVGKGEMVRQRIINQYLPTFVRRLHQSAEYKRSLGRVFSLAIGKGFIDGISIGRKDIDIQAILKDSDVDPLSFDIFIDEYEKLFDQRYSYVDKVARMYLLDPSGLQNVMPDETGPTPGGGPRDTPTPSYA
ncbi:hypothetical protein Tco_1427847 [Tanacetum coccineum]